MDCSKVGALILKLRKEKKMTQKDIAMRMNISDKTISKWERGQGCPDVSLLTELSKVLGVNIDKILLGDLQTKNIDGGNMKRIKFYACSICNNVITSISEAEISCCGRKTDALVPKQEDEEHKISVREIENDYYITMKHKMSKDHYISFIAFVAYDKVLVTKLYPEQNPEIRIPKMYQGKIYAYCNEHGLRVTTSRF